MKKNDKKKTAKKVTTSKGKSKKFPHATDETRMIESKIRRGDFAKIANELYFDPSHVSRVIRGISINPDGSIIKYAKKLVSKRK
jgi:hypothetical protein